MNKLSQARLLESHSQEDLRGTPTHVRYTPAEYKKMVRLYTVLEDMLAQRSYEGSLKGMKDLKALLHALRENECMVQRHIAQVDAAMRKKKL